MRIELNQEPGLRVRLLVAYDGAAFSGFARNTGVVTVAGELEDQLTRILRHPVVVTGAGRTDKGVHAWGQVVHFDTFADLFDPVRMMRSINNLCAPALVIREAEAVPPGFDARFSAQWRRYRYTVLNTLTPNPFHAAQSWHVEAPLSMPDMAEASQMLIGLHDFSSFCRRPPVGPDEDPKTLMRNIWSIDWRDLDGERFQVELTAKAFCHQMVRSIVGTLIDVGRGHRRPPDMAAILEAQDRSVAGNLAPPHGLCLWEVGY